MTLSGIHNFFVILVWIAAFFTAIGGLGSWITGRMIDDLKNKQIEGLKNQVQGLEPRTLTETQKVQLIEKLRTYNEPRRVGFYSRMMDRESAEFADTLATAFKEAGWDVTPTNRSSLNDYPGFLVMFIVGNPPETLPAFIQQAFQSIGIDCHPENIKESSLSGGREIDRLYIVVGSKI